MKSGTRVIIFLVAIIFLFSCGAGIAAADNGFAEFRDTEGYWAAETIARVAALDLVKGYPGGKFEPRNQVSRQELVVMMVRTLGLENEASKYGNPATYGYSTPDVGDWAKGPIVLAAHRGWIGTDLKGTNFRAAASRLDVAMIVARALKLSTDNAVITFADLDKIPQSHRPYVAAVVREGIMQGVPGNMFEPTRGVTRAEMTALITNILDAGLADPYPGRQFVAQLRAVAGNTVTLRTAAGDKTYDLAGFYLAFRANKKVTPGSLVGENVNVVLDGNNKVRFLGYTTSGVSGTPGPGSGDVKDPVKDPDKDKSKDSVRAYVINKYLDHITVRYDDGKREELDIHSSTRFYQGTRLADYSAVSRGVRVELTKSGSVLAEVRVLDEARKLFGKVVSLSSSKVSIEDGDGHQVSVEFADRVRVQDSDGARMDLDDIDRDNRVELRLDKDGRADLVTLDFRKGDKEGVVTQIRTGHTPRITIEDDREREYSHYIRDDVRVTKDGKTIRLSDVGEGDKVRLWLDRYDEVIEIEVLEEDRGFGQWGTVTGLDLSKKQITVQRGSRTEKYDLDRDVRVQRDGKTLYLDEVLIGAEVELTVVGGRVITIEIIDDENIWVEGEIAEIDKDRGRLIIEQENGAKFRFDFAKGAILRDRNGDRIDIDDLRTGWMVELDLRDGEIYRLNRI